MPLSTDDRVRLLEQALGLGDDELALAPPEETDPREHLDQARLEACRTLDELAGLGDDQVAERLRLSHRVDHLATVILANAGADDPETRIRTLEAERAYTKTLADRTAAEWAAYDEAATRFGLIPSTELAEPAKQRLPEIDAEIHTVRRQLDEVYGERPVAWLLAAAS